MNTNIEAQHYKYNKKFECLEEIAHNLSEIDEIKDRCNIDKRILEINKLKIKYQELISPVLHEYYKLQSDTQSNDCKKLQEQYQNVTMSENIISEMDCHFEQLCKCISANVQTKKRRKRPDKKIMVVQPIRDKKILENLIQRDQPKNEKQETEN